MKNDESLPNRLKYNNPFSFKEINLPTSYCAHHTIYNTQSFVFLLILNISFITIFRNILLSATEFPTLILSDAYKEIQA